MPKLKFTKGQVVRFTEDYLASSQDAFRKRFADRVGVIGGYRLGATNPIVDFPKTGRRSECRLFEVDPLGLELLPST